MTIASRYAIALLLTVGPFAIGCSSNKSEQATETAHDEHEHGHASTGPHGGDLIELGSEEYHAEITHDGEVVVHMLDGSAKTAVPVHAKEVVLNVSHDGKAEQFSLMPKTDGSESEGKSSSFSSSDAELLADLNEGHAEVQLVVSINGTQFRGSLEHAHGEEGHDH